MKKRSTRQGRKQIGTTLTKPNYSEPPLLQPETKKKSRDSITHNRQEVLRLEYMRNLSEQQLKELLMTGKAKLVNQLGFDKEFWREAIRFITQEDEEGMLQLSAKMGDLVEWLVENEGQERPAVNHLQVEVEVMKAGGLDPASLVKNPLFDRLLKQIREYGEANLYARREDLRERMEAGDEEAFITAAREGLITEREIQNLQRRGKLELLREMGEAISNIGSGRIKGLSLEEERRSKRAAISRSKALKRLLKKYEKWKQHYKDTKRAYQQTVEDFKETPRIKDSHQKKLILQKFREHVESEG